MISGGCHRESGVTMRAPSNVLLRMCVRAYVRARRECVVRVRVRA
jgi:hypothetical protein